MRRESLQKMLQEQCSNYITVVTASTCTSNMRGPRARALILVETLEDVGVSETVIYKGRQMQRDSSCAYANREGRRESEGERS